MKTTFKIARTSMFAAPLALVAGMAAAGGLSEPIATPAPVMVAPAPVMMSNDWTGFYVGGQVGYGRLQSDSVPEADEEEGAIYGVHAGYNYDFGSIILGGELDFDGTNIEIAGANSEVESVARAKLKLGYDAGQFMPYITAGAARVTTTDGLDGETDGTFAGLGLSYMASDSLIIGGEVLQHQFEDVIDTPDADVDATTLTLRVSYKF